MKGEKQTAEVQGLMMKIHDMGGDQYDLDIAERDDVCFILQLISIY